MSVLSAPSRLKACICTGASRMRSNGRYWYVECEECDRATVHCPTREEAETIWNEIGPGT